MTSENFCYWLQGWFELNSTIDHREGATVETLEMIKAHLNMVFIHEIDPKLGNAEHQAKLDEAHSGPTNQEIEDTLRTPPGRPFPRHMTQTPGRDPSRVMKC